MFSALDTRDNKAYTIYDIQYDVCGYPTFLVYRDNQWIRNSGKHYVPVVNVQGMTLLID